MEHHIEQRVETLLKQLTLKEKAALLSGRDNWYTVAIPRLGIPSLVMSDGPHGVRADEAPTGRPMGPATSFPTGVSMAASWDSALIERVGAALAEETRAMGCDILLGPCVNIMRTPLAGRNFESYAEDPYLAGRIGIAWVRGLQSQGVGASLKHYACNNQEFERNRGSSVVDERTLREIYLAQFEAVVKEADPWTVMCSYNRINGVYASENYYLLTEILKDEWGFQGVVVSDWGANHTILESVAGGLDLEMPGPAKYYGQLLVEAVRTWQLDESVVDEAARRMLRMIVRSGQMDAPARIPAGAVNTPEHQALARALAEQSITLLKNDGELLPLRDVKSIAVIGPNAAEARIGGGGSSYLEPPYAVSPLAGLLARLGETVEITYAEGCDNYASPPVLPSALLTPAQGAGPGLWAEYFNNTELAGEPEATTLEAKLAFWWMYLPPNIRREAFSVRYTGTFTAPVSGRCQFRLINSGIARLYLDGELLIHSDAIAHPKETEWGATFTDGFVTLEAGQSYALRVEFSKPEATDSYMLYLQFAYAPLPENDDRIEQAVTLARRADVAVICAGMPTGFESEGHDRADMRLPGRQNELIRAVAAANPNTVVVLNAGSPVEMPWIAEVPAVVLAYYPGQEGGNALASVLAGDVTPSGKLTVTFPKRYEDNPTYGNYPGDREVIYGEGLLVGYRYYDAKDIAPLFPFGHGLSYTTFAYSDLQLPATAAVGEPVRVRITLTNTGACAGAEVAQLYVHDREARVFRPPQELKAFAKVQLEPGASQIVEFTLDERAFAYYDVNASAWAAEPGAFDILVGASSRDIRARGEMVLQ